LAEPMPLAYVEDGLALQLRTSGHIERREESCLDTATQSPPARSLPTPPRGSARRGAMPRHARSREV
jgi:hypothetical protein